MKKILINLPITNIEKFKIIKNLNVGDFIESRKECFWLSMDESETIHFSFKIYIDPTSRTFQFEGIMIRWDENPFDLTLDDNYVMEIK